jgi:hypothetical protein
VGTAAAGLWLSAQYVNRNLRETGGGALPAPRGTIPVRVIMPGVSSRSTAHDWRGTPI